MTVAFLALAVALGATARQFHSWLFAIACATMGALAATPKARESRTVGGAIHTIAGFVFFVVTAVAALSWSPNEPRKTVAWLVCIATGLFIAALVGPRRLREVAGYYQRLVFALIVTWLLLPA